MAVDHVEAVRVFLKADPAVEARVNTRLFAVEVPPTQNASMPRAAVVLSPAGGGLIGRGYQAYSDKRIDVDCYGVDRRESFLLHLDVYTALKDLRRKVSAGVLLHWARVSADAITARDPRTGWPVTVSSWQLLVSEIPA